MNHSSRFSVAALLLLVAGLILAVNSASAQTYTLSTLATLESRNGGPGGDPDAGLILSGSTLYGTTTSGGATPGIYGTVFSVPVGGGTPTSLATFNGTNGQWPRG